MNKTAHEIVKSSAVYQIARAEEEMRVLKGKLTVPVNDVSEIDEIIKSIQQKINVSKDNTSDLYNIIDNDIRKLDEKIYMLKVHVDPMLHVFHQLLKMSIGEEEYFSYRISYDEDTMVLKIMVKLGRYIACNISKLTLSEIRELTKVIPSIVSGLNEIPQYVTISHSSDYTNDIQIKKTDRFVKYLKKNPLLQSVEALVTPEITKEHFSCVFDISSKNIIIEIKVHSQSYVRYSVPLADANEVRERFSSIPQTLSLVKRLPPSIDIGEDFFASWQDTIRHIPDSFFRF